MSWQASDHVRRLQGVTASEKAVLYSLADRHNVDDKGCWPRMKLIAKESGDMTPRGAQKIVARLVEKGVLVVTYRKRDDGTHTSNFYQFAGLDTVNEMQGVTNVVQGVVNGGSYHESPIEPPIRGGARAIYDQVFRDAKNASSEVFNEDLFFGKWKGGLDVNPDRIVIAIETMDKARPANLRELGPIRVPAPGVRWQNLERLGTFFYAAQPLSFRAIHEAMQEVVPTDAYGPNWNGILSAVAGKPDKFIEAYQREAR